MEERSGAELKEFVTAKGFGGDRLETLLLTEKYYHTQLAYPLKRGSLTSCEDIYFSRCAYTFI